MPASSKRGRPRSPVAVTLAASTAAAAGSHSAAAASTPAAAVGAAPTDKEAPGSSSTAEEEDSGSESEDEEETEYIVVRMPASLVKHMRHENGHVVLEALDTAQPYFDATFTPAPITAAAAEQPAPKKQRYVGAYEYTVGTQLLWRIHEDTPPSKLTANASSSAPSPARSVSGTTGSTPSPLSVAGAAAAAAAASLRTSPPPLPLAHPAPHIEFVANTWKRLNFTRQR